jgi:hypothetical protein
MKEEDSCKKILLDKKGMICWVPVAYSYNPSYSGGRDQEDLAKKKKGWWWW